MAIGNSLNTGQLLASTSSPTFSGLLLKGGSSGIVTINPQAVAGTYNFNLPTTAGATGQFLTSAGGSGSPMTWTTSPSLSRPVTNVNFGMSPYTVLATDSWIEVDSSGGAVSIILQAPASGRFLTIMDALGTSFTNNITVTVSGGALINGSASQVIAFAYQGNDYISNTTYWSMK